jgi:hypothetical protein
MTLNLNLITTFEWTWDEQAFGEHTIKVVAYHSGESVTDSMVATIFHL